MKPSMCVLRLHMCVSFHSMDSKLYPRQRLERLQRDGRVGVFHAMRMGNQCISRIRHLLRQLLVFAPVIFLLPEIYRAVASSFWRLLGSIISGIFVIIMSSHCLELVSVVWFAQLFCSMCFQIRNVRGCCCAVGGVCFVFQFLVGYFQCGLRFLSHSGFLSTVTTFSYISPHCIVSIFVLVGYAAQSGPFRDFSGAVSFYFQLVFLLQQSCIGRRS